MKLHLLILCIVNLATLIFAWINNTEEGLLPTTLFFAQTILGALASGVGATLVFLIVSKIRRKIDFVFATIAYCSSVFGMAMYAMYASSGKADNVNSAAHMHIIVFPLLHAFLTLMALILGALLSAAIYFLFQRKQQTQQVAAPNP